MILNLLIRVLIKLFFCQKPFAISRTLQLIIPLPTWGTDVVLGFAVRCVVNARDGVEVHCTVKKQLQILSLRNLVGMSNMMP